MLDKLRLTPFRCVFFDFDDESGETTSCSCDGTLYENRVP